MNDPEQVDRQDVCEALVVAAEICAEPVIFTQRTMFRDFTGHPTDIGHACKVCMLGAISLVAVSFYRGPNDVIYRKASKLRDQMESYLTLAANELYYSGPATVNDDFGSNAVQRTFRRAIEMVGEAVAA